jgi:phosphatidylinositol glycan class W
MFCCLFSSKVNIGLTAIILLIFHQICLTFFGLSTFIQNDDRNGLLAANKEGIISLLGYLSLHLFFVEVGRFLLRMRLYFDQKIKNFKL